VSATSGAAEGAVTLTVCRICGAAPNFVSKVHGRYSGRTFTLARCPECGYAFIADPWLEYDRIYDDRYYAGEGADPLVDYSYELDHPGRTVRAYEWKGIAMVVAELIGPVGGRRWIDFGCGNGGLVRYLRDRAGVDAVGYEEGAVASRAAAVGIPVHDRDAFPGWAGSADVVTAIEVIEHTHDPVAELRVIRRLLRPGGLLFLTTGNARAHRHHLDKWRYVVPEIHISFFEPRTLARAMTEAGFRPEQHPRGGGFDEILAFKVLKNLRVRKRSRLTDALPRRPLGLLADRMERLSEHPVGWAV
jgi:SAM-dependent methyltransferase